MVKELLCRLFGHTPKRYPPLHLWENGKAVPLLNNGPIFCEKDAGPIFCSRCGAGAHQIWIVDGINGIFGRP